MLDQGSTGTQRNSHQKHVLIPVWMSQRMSSGAGVALELGCVSKTAARELEMQLQRGGGWPGMGLVEAVAGAEGLRQLVDS
jgi:hypothetical protein